MSLGYQVILIVTLGRDVGSQTLKFCSSPFLFWKRGQEGTSREPHWVLPEHGTIIIACLRIGPWLLSA